MQSKALTHPFLMTRGEAKGKLRSHLKYLPSKSHLNDSALCCGVYSFSPPKRYLPLLGLFSDGKEDEIRFHPILLS